MDRETLAFVRHAFVKGVFLYCRYKVFRVPGSCGSGVGDRLSGTGRPREESKGKNEFRVGAGARGVFRPRHTEEPGGRKQAWENPSTPPVNYDNYDTYPYRPLSDIPSQRVPDAVCHCKLADSKGVNKARNSAARICLKAHACRVPHQHPPPPKCPIKVITSMEFKIHCEYYLGMNPFS
ncbi:hypothetical protein VTK56DRAFT_9786 [Thermocarpiscus australiensis]